MQIPARYAIPVAAILCGLVLVAATDKSMLNFQGRPEPVPPPQGPMGILNPMLGLARTMNFSAARASSYQRQGGPRDNFYIPTDGSEVTLAELTGPGAINHIWTTHRGDGRELILRIYWEGSKHPSVEAPLGDFFGVAMGLDAPMNSLPVQTSSLGRARNCWWYMPYNKSARVTIQAADSPVNRKRSRVALYFYIDYILRAEPMEDINYFHARFIETDPAQRGKPVLLAEAEGQGHFVGVVMGHRNRTPGWFGEGDDIIRVDGQVSFLGTGTEDYFGEAWGFRVFSNHYYGVPAIEGHKVGDRLSVYRFHIMDPIPFRKSFRFEIEHWPWISSMPNSSRGYYSSVGFWYQNRVHKAWPRLRRIISHEPWDPAKGRWHRPGVLEAEDLKVLEHQSNAKDNPPPRIKLVMPNLSGDKMLLFDPGTGGSFTLAVPAAQAGLHTVTLYCPRAGDYGKVQLTVNDRIVGRPVDTYLHRQDLVRPFWPPRAYTITGVELKKGINRFKFTAPGKNAKSKGYRIGLDCLGLKKE